jgi:hypothetical protein
LNKQLEPIGIRAPAPVAGETVGGYRRRAVQTVVDSTLPQRNRFARVDYLNIDYPVFKNLEPQAIQECVIEYQNPANVSPGEFRKIERLDGYGKVMCIDWIGQESTGLAKSILRKPWVVLVGVS